MSDLFYVLASTTRSSYSSYSSYPKYSTSYEVASGASSAFVTIFTIIYYIIFFAALVVQLIAMWKIFEKAGIEGWKAIIPIYNIVVLYQLVGLNPYLVLTVLIPCFGPFVLAIISYIAYYKLALAFGKSTGFAIGLMFLTPIFACILGFGKSEFQGVPEKA